MKLPFYFKNKKKLILLTKERNISFKFSPVTADVS